MRHQALDVDAIRSGQDHETYRVLVVRLVAEILDPGELPGEHLSRNLLEHPAARDLVGQSGDHHCAVLRLVARPHPYGADSAAVEGEQLLPRRDDLCIAGVVGAEHVATQIFQLAIRLLQQVEARAGHLAHMWGGRSVAMPTAIPDAPLSSTCGRRAGRIMGSSSVPSKLASHSTVP